MDTISIEHLDAMLDFQYHVGPAEFQQVFGTSVGSHLWARFKQADSSLLKLFASLSENNAVLLVAHLNQRSQMLQEVLR